jgi:hypothetical protein
VFLKLIQDKPGSEKINGRMNIAIPPIINIMKKPARRYLRSVAVRVLHSSPSVLNIAKQFIG